VGRAVLAVLFLASVVAAGDPPAFQGLTADLWAARLEDWSTYDEAAAALAAGGPEAVAVLDALLREHHALGRLPYVIEAVPDPRPLVPALLLLLADDDAKVRQEAVHALRRIGPGGAAAVPALVRALCDTDELTADRAAGALGAIGAGAVPALIEALSDPRTRRRAAEALGRVGADAATAVRPLLALLGDTTANWDERSNAAEALGGIGASAPAAIPDLARGLADPDETVRRECAEALGKIGDAAGPAVPALIDAVGDKDDSVRREATDTLWRLGEPAIRALVGRFQASEDRSALGAALAAGKRNALPYLVPLLSDPAASWLKDAEAALALVGWEALCVLPADHPSAARVTARVLVQGVVRRVQPPRHYRTVAAALPSTDPLAVDATWETGSGHGFTLALYRGRWTPDGFTVRAMSYAQRRPRRVGEKETETVSVRTTTIPRDRANAMIRMVLAASAVTFEKERKSDGRFLSSSRDFHATLALRTGATVLFDEGYTGYASSIAEREYARVIACTELLGEGLETCEWIEAEPNDEDRAILAARLGRIEKDDWWVRERLLLIAKAIGDVRCLPPIEAFLATEPDETPRDQGYAIDAYAAISGTDLRPTPFREKDIAATRERYLEHFARR
jgi:HEAT repeat protein